MTRGEEDLVGKQIARHRPALCFVDFDADKPGAAVGGLDRIEVKRVLDRSLRDGLSFHLSDNVERERFVLRQREGLAGPETEPSTAQSATSSERIVMRPSPASSRTVGSA